MCGADGHALWRVAGQHGRGRGQTGDKTLVTQRARVGFCLRCRSVAHIAIPGSLTLGAHYPQKDVVMQLRQAFGPWGPRRYSAFQYVAGNGYLPKDWDWAASTLNVHPPPLPYLVSSSMGGICVLISGGVPPLRRAVPNFADVPAAPSNEDTVVNVAADLPEPVNRATARQEIRVPPMAPKPPPPVLSPRGNENGPTADVPSEYQSDWFGYWYTSSWTWNRNCDRPT